MRTRRFLLLLVLLAATVSATPQRGGEQSGAADRFLGVWSGTWVLGSKGGSDVIVSGGWKGKRGAAAQTAPQASLADRFTIRDVMIPARDGVKLHTKIFTPKDQKEPLPIIMSRTPYGVAGAAGRFTTYLRALVDEGYRGVTAGGQHLGCLRSAQRAAERSQRAERQEPDRGPGR